MPKEHVFITCSVIPVISTINQNTLPTVPTPYSDRDSYNCKSCRPTAFLHRPTKGITSVEPPSTALNNEPYELTDTLRFRDYTLYYNGGKKGKIPLRFGALRRNLRSIGKACSTDRDIMSFVQQQLSEMNVFSTVKPEIRSA